MKVALVGGAPGWQDAPFSNKAWMIWVLGNQMNNYTDKRVDRIFQIHDNLSHFDPKFPEWVAGLNIPMIVGDKFPIKADHVKVFDYEEALKLIGENFSSSLAVMMAQAIMDGAKEIAIYGVNMSIDEHEYYYQRPSMEQWIGYAKGLGIKITVSERSPLGRCDMRESGNFDTDRLGPFTEDQFLMIKKQHENAILQIDRNIKGLELNKAAHQGAIDTYERLRSIARAEATGHRFKKLSDGICLNVEN